MVRNIAGMLMAVGYKENTVEWVEEVLSAKDRTLAGITALPNGLYLTSVEYPKEYSLEKFPPEPVFWH